MKTIIIHHTDRDGIVSGAIMIQWIKKLRNEGPIDITTKAVDYTYPLATLVSDIDSYDRIVMVDYSISTEENAKWVLTQKANGKQVIWIDHHHSSFTSMEKYPELAELDGIRVNGIAGCGLCWLYTKEIQCNFTEIDKDGAVKLLKLHEAPEVVIYSHRYDIWDTSTAVINFARAFNPATCTDVELYTALQYPKYDHIVIERSLEEGKIITKALDAKNENVANSIGFEFDIIDDTGEVPAIYKAFAMNDVFSSSLNFGDRINRYDIVVPFYFNGDKFVYSMYSAKESVDVEPLCVALGGGGHRHAAGFTSKTLDIKKGGELIIK